MVCSISWNIICRFRIMSNIIIIVVLVLSLGKSLLSQSNRNISITIQNQNQQEYYINKKSFPFPSSELNALYSLYNSTNGAQWNWMNSSQGSIWNFSQPSPNPCSQAWQGITCTSDCSTAPCSVTVLSLNDFGMVGTLPEQLGDLSKLIRLSISSNEGLIGM
jgi:hypothetical protein